MGRRKKRGFFGSSEAEDEVKPEAIEDDWSEEPEPVVERVQLPEPVQADFETPVPKKAEVKKADDKKTATIGVSKKVPGKFRKYL